jgi:hypothetical protein
MCAALIPRSFRSFPMGWRCRPRVAKNSGEMGGDSEAGTQGQLLARRGAVALIPRQARLSHQ